jgi:hypothetical protein
MSKLAEAKQILAERGRTTEVLEDGKGCLCPIGALAMAHTGFSGQTEDVDAYRPADPDHAADLSALVKVAKRRLGHESRSGNSYIFVTPYTYVYRYNDDASRPDEEVLSLFDEALELVNG